jgi:Icc-related predicted phosphoesterase
LEDVCERVRRQLRQLAMPRDRIVLLTHYPPLVPGLFPPRRGRTAAAADGGSASIAALVQELQPLAIVQGHEHRWAGLVGRHQLPDHDVLIVNPARTGMAVIIDAEQKRADIG